MTHPALSYNKKLDQTESFWACVQWLCNQKISAGLVVDGILGPKTCQAVEDFQRSKRIAADGKLGPQTLSAFDDPDLRLQSLREKDDAHPLEDIISAYPDRPIFIDVSKHQGDIQWDIVKAAGVGAVIMKATEGRTHQDHRFRENYTEAQRAGLKCGTYHYAYLVWDKKDGRGKQPTNPATQAQNWINELKAVNAQETFGSWLDLETHHVEDSIKVVGKVATVDWIFAFADAFKERFGKPLRALYLSGRSIDALGSEAERLLERFGLFWWARYPRMPFPFSAEYGEQYGRHEPSKHREGYPWFAWQFSCRGHVPGIEGDVDLNLYNGETLRDV